MKKLISTIILISFIGTLGFGRKAHAAATELYSTSLYSDANLVAYYRLENTSDSKASYTLTNNNSVAFSSAKFNNGADGGTSNTNKTLSRDDSYGMLGSTGKTYVFWGKVNTAPSTGDNFCFYRHLFGGSAVGNYSNVCYRNLSGTLQVTMPTSPGGLYSNYTLTVGTFYHFAVTVPANNTGDITLYLNGSSFGTTANWSQNYALTTRLVILGDHALGSNAEAIVDDFAVFNRVLTSTEINTLYTGPADSAKKANLIFFE